MCENDCEIITISRDKLDKLFEQDSRLGYTVMRNLAQLLAERLRRKDWMVL